MITRMLQQALRVSGRGALPLAKWMERWAEGAAAKQQGLKTLDDMPGPTVAGFAWDLFVKRGISRLHEQQVSNREQVKEEDLKYLLLLT